MEMMERIIIAMRGSVRSVVTYAFSGAFIVMALNGTIDAKTFVPVATAVISFWFAKGGSSNKED